VPRVLLYVEADRSQSWKCALEDRLPGFDVVLWDDHRFDNVSITYAVVWMPPPGMLASLPNLRCVFALGAGVSHILRDDSYPRRIPIVRTTSDDLRMRMGEYVALHVLRFHRRLPEIELAQAERRWLQYVVPPAKNIVVAILGVGNLGRPAGQVLRTIGYPVLGWSRRGRPVDGISVYTGECGLHSMLRNANIAVCMLPETAATQDLLNLERLSLMPRGSYFINVGRGGTVVDADLIQLLRTGHIAGAALDVFRTEPLPAIHPYWTMPNVIVTSHTASAIDPATCAQTVAENMLAFESGQSLPAFVDVEQGY
jgi:glyoxylate/hydroxypyruvate reductase A